MEFNIRKKRQGDTSSVSSAGAKAEQTTRSAGVQFNIRKAETSRQSSRPGSRAVYHQKVPLPHPCPPRQPERRPGTQRKEPGKV